MGVVKLTGFLGLEWNKYTGLEKNMQFLRGELSAMVAFLDTMAVDDDELNEQAKQWRNQVREMTYDIEDRFDDFVHHFHGDEAAAIHKIINTLKMLWKGRQIANEIYELKHRVFEEDHCRKRYRLDDFCKITSPTSNHVDVDPRIAALYEEAEGLVGIDGSMKELVQLLSMGVNTDQQRQHKVVSIVGFGGLGKTTLAKHLYEKVGDEFECKAFVSVSQRPDIAGLLGRIQSKLKKTSSSQACEDIIDSIRSHLSNKRYIIVVDDLWDEEAWSIIKCAFPENRKGSRVIVTTRLEDVAILASGNHQGVYKMRPLVEEDERRLFCKRVFASEDGCPSQYKEVSTEILKKCAGLPLAIITIASMLACQPARIIQEWENIRNSLGSPFCINPNLEGMRRILNLSYKNLPPHLRTCLMYLGKYPEDQLISREDVVRQWMAEEFVSDSRGQDKEDVANSYFNELVNRGLVQPDYIDNGGGGD